MLQILFWFLLLGSCGYAFLRGRSDERIAAVVCFAATVLTIYFAAPYPVRYSRVEDLEMLIDLLMLGVFVLMALRSHRFWPLWVAGLQLTITTSHALKAVDQHLIPQVYAVAERFWSYPILVILIIATWRGSRRDDHSPELA